MPGTQEQKGDRNSRDPGLAVHPFMIVIATIKMIKIMIIIKAKKKRHIFKYVTLVFRIEIILTIIGYFLKK